MEERQEHLLQVLTDAMLQVRSNEGDEPHAGDLLDSIEILREELPSWDLQDCVYIVQTEEGEEIISWHVPSSLVQVKLGGVEEPSERGLLDSIVQVKIEEAEEALASHLQDSVGQIEFEEGEPHSWVVASSVSQAEAEEDWSPSDGELQDSIVQSKTEGGEGPSNRGFHESIVQVKTEEVEEPISGNLEGFVVQVKNEEEQVLARDLQNSVDLIELEEGEQPYAWEIPDSMAQVEIEEGETLSAWEPLGNSRGGNRPIQEKRTGSGIVKKNTRRCFKRGKTSLIQTKLHDKQRSLLGHRLLQSSGRERGIGRSSYTAGHRRVHEGGRRRYMCTECGKMFSTSSAFSVHRRSHVSPRVYTCSVCVRLFHRSSTFYLHRRAHALEQPYKCSRCGKSFSRGSALYMHLRTLSLSIQQGEGAQMHSECRMGVIRQANLHRHQEAYSREESHAVYESAEGSIRQPPASTAQQSVQPTVQECVCAKCGKGFTHYREASRLTIARVPGVCCDCKTSFPSRPAPVKHQHKHKKGTLYDCDECGKSFKSNSQLTKHKLFLIDEREKLFTCSECGRGFGRHSHLTTHQLTHAGENPYLCSECGQSFPDPSSFITHQRTHRKRIASKIMYVCTECDASFKFPSRLKAHLLRHQKAQAGEQIQPAADTGESAWNPSELLTHPNVQEIVKHYICTNCGNPLDQSSHVTRISHVPDKGPQIYVVMVRCLASANSTTTGIGVEALQIQ